MWRGGAWRGGAGVAGFRGRGSRRGQVFVAVVVVVAVVLW